MAARNILRLGVTGRLLGGLAKQDMKRNRWALIRDALREHLRRSEIRALEQRDRDGYMNAPPTDEALVWEAEAAWPRLTYAQYVRTLKG